MPLVYLVEAVNRVFVPSSAPAPKGNSKQMDSSAAVKNPSAQSHQVIAQGLEVVEDIKSMLKGLVALQKVDPAF